MSDKKKDRTQTTVPIFKKYHPTLWSMFVDGNGKIKTILGGGRGRAIADFAEKGAAAEMVMAERYANVEAAILSMQEMLSKIVVNGGVVTQEDISDLQEQQDAFQSEFGDIFNQ